MRLQDPTNADCPVIDAFLNTLDDPNPLVNIVKDRHTEVD